MSSSHWSMNIRPISWPHWRISMVTVADCIRQAVKLQAVSDSPRLDVELLLGRATGKSRTWLYTWPEAEVDNICAAKFYALLARRKKGEPIAHILGEKEFWSLPLYVDESTLIPRPETELLVELVLALDVPRRRLLDLGTGTGAIALALARELPDADILAVDSSLDAVALAQKNQARLSCPNIQIKHSDWFSSITENEFDIIVSNPPYIDRDDPHLQKGDVSFEPHSALVAADNGLADIHHIIREAHGFLCLAGVLLLEHGFQQGVAVRELFNRYGFLNVETRQDIDGRDRVSLGYKR